MDYFSQSLFVRVEAEEVGSEPVLLLGEVVGEASDMKPAWAEGSRVFHTKDRCARFRAIAEENLRRSAAPPPGFTLCEFCRLITLIGRRG